MSPLQPAERNELGRLLAIASIGFEMVVPIGLGWLVDRYLGWSPWGIVAGVTLGLVGGITHLFLLTNVQDQHERRGSAPPPREGS